jgi:hypothetical protein
MDVLSLTLWPAPPGGVLASSCYPVRAVGSEAMYRPGSSNNFTAVPGPFTKEVLMSSIQRNALPVDHECVSPVYYDHVYVVIVDMCS